MIKNYKQLSIRKFKSNKTCSLLAIILVTFVVILINYEVNFLNSVYTAGWNFIKSGFDNPPNVDIEYPNLNNNIIWDIANNLQVKDYGIIGANNEPSELNNKIPIIINYFSNSNMTKLSWVTGYAGCIPDPIKGRLPKNKQEIMVEEDLLKSLSLNLNDKIEVDKSEYKLVGICQEDGSEFKEKNMVYIKEDAWNIAKSKCDYTLLIKIREDVNFDQAIRKLTKGLTTKDYLLYNELNQYTKYKFTDIQILNDYFPIVKNNLQKSILFTIIFWLICIITIFSIIRSIIKDRIDEMKLLSAIGATQIQIKKIILREILFIVIIGTIIGILASFIVTPKYNLSLDYYKLVSHGLNTSLEDIELDFFNLNKTNYLILLLSSLNILIIYTIALFIIKFDLKYLRLPKIAFLISLKDKLIKISSLKKYFKNTFGFKFMIILKGLKNEQNRFHLNTFLIIIFIICILFIDNYFQKVNLNYTQNIKKFSTNVAFTINNTEYFKKTTNNDIQLQLNELRNHLYQSINYSKIKQFYKFSEANLEVLVYKNKLSQISYNQKNPLLKILLSQPFTKTLVSVYDNNAFSDFKAPIMQNKSIIWVENCISNGLEFDDNVKFVNSKDKLRIEVSNEPLYPSNEMYLNRFSNAKSNKINLNVAQTIKKNVFTSNIITVSGNHIIMTEKNFEELIGEKVIYNGIIITLKDKKYANDLEKELNNLLKKYPGFELTNILAENRANYSLNEAFHFKLKVIAYVFLVILVFIFMGIIFITNKISIIARKRDFTCLVSIGMSQNKLQNFILAKIFLSIGKGIIYGLLLGSILLTLNNQHISFKFILIYIKDAPFGSIFLFILGLILMTYFSTVRAVNNFYKRNVIETLKEEF